MQPEQVVFPHVGRLTADGALRPLQRPAQLAAHVLEPLQQLRQDTALLQPGHDPGCVLLGKGQRKHGPLGKVWNSLVPLSHSFRRLLPGVVQLSRLLRRPRRIFHVLKFGEAAGEVPFQLGQGARSAGVRLQE